MKSYLTFAQVGVLLGYRGEFAGQSARKWAERRHMPRFWRGRCWLVRASDVEAALRGKEWTNGPDGMADGRRGGLRARGVLGLSHRRL